MCFCKRLLYVCPVLAVGLTVVLARLWSLAAPSTASVCGVAQLLCVCVCQSQFGLIYRPLTHSTLDPASNAGMAIPCVVVDPPGWFSTDGGQMCPRSAASGSQKGTCSEDWMEKIKTRVQTKETTWGNINLSESFIHSTFVFYHFILFMFPGGAGANPSSYWQGGGYTPDSSPVHDSQGHITQQNNHLHSCSRLWSMASEQAYFIQKYHQLPRCSKLMIFMFWGKSTHHLSLYGPSHLNCQNLFFYTYLYCWSNNEGENTEFNL